MVNVSPSHDRHAGLVIIEISFAFSNLQPFTGILIDGDEIAKGMPGPTEQELKPEYPLAGSR